MWRVITGLFLEQSRGSPFLNNGITFAILQRFGNSPVVKERFTKYALFFYKNNFERTRASYLTKS